MRAFGVLDHIRRTCQSLTIRFSRGLLESSPDPGHLGRRAIMMTFDSNRGPVTEKNWPNFYVVLGQLKHPKLVKYPTCMLKAGTCMFAWQCTATPRQQRTR